MSKWRFYYNYYYYYCLFYLRIFCIDTRLVVHTYYWVWFFHNMLHCMLATYFFAYHFLSRSACEFKISFVSELIKMHRSTLQWNGYFILNFAFNKNLFYIYTLARFYNLSWGYVILTHNTSTPNCGIYLLCKLSTNISKSLTLFKLCVWRLGHQIIFVFLSHLFGEIHMLAFGMIRLLISEPTIVIIVIMIVIGV